MTPALVRKLPLLNCPVDNGIRFRGKRLLGNNKTIRGLLFGVLFGLLVASAIDHWTGYGNAWLMGVLLGLFAMLGDMIESIIKRQLGIAPGKQFLPFDQIDWVIGASIPLGYFGFITLAEFAVALILFFILHVMLKHVGYFLGFDTKRW